MTQQHGGFGTSFAGPPRPTGEFGYGPMNYMYGGYAPPAGIPTWGAPGGGHYFGPYVPYGVFHGPHPADGRGSGAGAQTSASGVGGASAFGLLNNRFVAGVLVGGALTYVLTNEAVQRAAIRAAMEIWINIQSGWEETKERFHDAEAEIKAAHDE